MNLQVIKNRIRKILAYAFTGILFLLITIFLILQMPPVQNAIVGRILRNFSNVSGFTSQIDNFKMLWFDRLELGGLTITDPEGNQMIAVRNVRINFQLAELLNQNDINIDGIILDSADVFLTRIAESDTSSNLNINIFVSELNKLSKGGSGGKNPTVNIGEAVLTNSTFRFSDPSRDTISTGFDFNHFSLLIDEGQVQNFLAIGDTVQFGVKTLLATEPKTDFSIHQLSTFFRVTRQSMEFSGLNLRTAKSFVSDSLSFSYESAADMSDFVNKVRIHAHLDSTVIHPEELALFAPGAEKIGRPITFSGKINGRVRKFKVSDMEASIDNTRMLGSLDLDGLPDIQETFIILNLKNSALDFNDFAFLLNDDALERLRPFGTITMHGQFLGYPQDFVANGDFSSRLGRIRSDINFKINEDNIDLSTYSGKLSTTGFKLGEYLGDTARFQDVSLTGDLVGKGLTLETADFTLNGRIHAIGFKGYKYANIISNAKFASEFFSGKMSINDPNLKFTAEGSVDLRNNLNEIKILANLDTAVLHVLNLTERRVFLRSQLDVDIRGLQIDSLVGTANLRDFYIQYEDQEMTLEQVRLQSEKDGSNRMVNLETTLFDAEITGDYTFTDLGKDINRLVQEIAMNFRNDASETGRYYRTKVERPKNYRADFVFTIKDVDPISELLALDLDVSGDTRIEGNFVSGYTTMFSAYSKVDTIDYQSNIFLNNVAEITASKIADSASVLAVAFINSEKQFISSGVNGENLVIEGVWNKRHIDFEIDGEQPAQGNYMRLKGIIDFMRDSTRIQFLPSPIHVLDRNWHIAAENEIVTKKKEWNFRNLEILNRDQSIRLHGALSEDSTKSLSLQIKNLDLSLANVFSNKNFGGVLQATMRLDDYYHNPSLQNVLSIKDLTVNDFLVGDVSGRNLYDRTYNQFDIDLMVDRMGSRIVNLDGAYVPQNVQPLNLDANLEKANLKILEPFLAETFSDIDGTVTGLFKITGDLNNPRINGEGLIDNGQIKINYTQALYKFVGTIGLRPNSIQFKEIELTDVLKNKGRLNGSISHRNFYEMVIDLRANFRNFQVLNTTPRDNSLFYGQGYATGDLQIVGPVENLRISSTARTEKNTRIFIPVGGTNVTEKQEFINFVSLTDTLQLNYQKNDDDNRIELTGINFDLNLDVTPDAYCEIIFDIKSGDIIRGRGNGDLKLQLDTKGEFNMFGSIEFSEGGYNFTLYDIINKEFQIERGSRISWFGDPYAATLNINAIYNQLASFAPIVNDPNLATSPELRRKYPVQVLLKLDGNMMAPNITFDILAPDLPQSVNIDLVRLDFLFESFKNKLDEQELKRQVFSLIVLRKFSPPEAFNTSGTLYNSVSELLSNQLSYWMSQMDENLEIDVDLGTMDQEAFNTFQLRLSYTLLNGRLRITRDGTLGNTDYGTQSTQNSLASIAGDWTVDYFLTADGKFKVKMYSRTNWDEINSSLNNQSYITTGVSLQHVQSFNEFKDLLKFSRKETQEGQPSAPGPIYNREAVKDEEGGL